MPCDLLRESMRFDWDLLRQSVLNLVGARSLCRKTSRWAWCGAGVCLCMASRALGGLHWRQDYFRELRSGKPPIQIGAGAAASATARRQHNRENLTAILWGTVCRRDMAWAGRWDERMQRHSTAPPTAGRTGRWHRARAARCAGAWARSGGRRARTRPWAGSTCKFFRSIQCSTKGLTSRAAHGNFPELLSGHNSRNVHQRNRVCSQSVQWQNAQLDAVHGRREQRLHRRPVRHGVVPHLRACCVHSPQTHNPLAACAAGHAQHQNCRLLACFLLSSAVMQSLLTDERTSLVM